MARVVGYHRPASIEEALAVLGTPGIPKVILGGGTLVNADPHPEPVEVVDLQALGLDVITEEEGALRLGAMTTLQTLVNDGRTPSLLAELARREAPSTLRAMGTVGGLIATGDPESELLAGLLVHDAVVTVVDTHGAVDSDLAELLEAGVESGMITEVSVATDGRGGSDRTARTPADRPIVAAVGRKSESGTVRIALCGVATTPRLVDDPQALDPPADFRGSSEYRKHLATVLYRRVSERLG